MWTKYPTTETPSTRTPTANTHTSTTPIPTAGIRTLTFYARKLFERFSFEARVPRLLPVASASIITLAGIGIALGALGQTGIV
jgi:hypothetical protein